MIDSPTDNPNQNRTTFARAVAGMDRRGDPCLHLIDDAGKLLVTLYRTSPDFEKALYEARLLLLQAASFVVAETAPERCMERKRRP
jgi:hypothetical protein